MNNRYIFRGKRKDNGEWIEGNLVYSQTTTRGIITEIYTLEMTYEVIPETVEQCSGVPDNNGKLIFEGDIVEDKESGLLGKVIFATATDGFDGMTGFMVDDVDDGLQNYNGFWHLVEIIGNEFDNPELLEVER